MDKKQVTQKIIILFIFGMFLFGCSSDDVDNTFPDSIGAKNIKGNLQKGPFLNGTSIFKIEGKYGVLDAGGDMTEAIFDEVNPDLEGWVEVKYNGEWGYIDEDGQFTKDEEEASFSASFDRFI